MKLKKLLFIPFILSCFTVGAQMSFSEYENLYAQFLKEDSSGMYAKVFKLGKDDNFYSHLAKGDYHLLNKNAKKALEEYSLAAEVCPEADSSRAFSNYKTGYFYYYFDNYPVALQFFNKASNFVGGKIKNNWHARLYMQIGAVYNTLGSCKTAVENYKLSMNYFRKNKDTKRLMNTMNNIAIAYMDDGDFVNGKIYFDSCLAYRIAEKDFYGIGQTRNNIGTLNFKQKKFDEALVDYLEGYEYRKKGNVPISGMIESQINIGKTYLKLNRYTEAKKWLDEAYQTAYDIDHIDLQKRSTEHLKDVYFQLGDFKNAYYYQEEYFRLYDTLYGLDKKIAVENITAQNELQNKMYQDSLLAAEKYKNDQAVAGEKEKRNKIIFYSLGAGLLFLSYFVFQLYRSNVQRKKTNSIITQQKDSLDQKQKEIIDSFNYARRIQYTLLAHEPFLKQNLRDHFIFFQPKDIVSGDFYWSTKKGNDFYLAICDCTGHGVPGAFMSLLNISFLNEAINEKNIAEPHMVLNYVREKLIQNMEGAQDGMDGTLIRFSEGKMSYASSHNKPLLIRNGEMKELPADKMPVGKGVRFDSFNLYEQEVIKNDLFYFYTDGYADQFGGAKGKKFKYANLQKLILENSDKVMNFQLHNLQRNFKEWKGDLEQIDDVCVIGIRI